MNYNNLLAEEENNILSVTINRPDKLNALNIETIGELHDILSKTTSSSTVRAVIITGSGEKAFVAGADISEFAGFSVEEGMELSRKGQKTLFDFIENMEVPVIAAVNGFALGGGLELAMACHIRVVSETARLGLPEVSLGVIPGYGGTQRLPELVGKGRALEMILTGDMINAEDAYRTGLANHITAPGELMDKAKSIATKMTGRSPVAVSAAIRAVNAGMRGEGNGFEQEIKEFGKCFGSNDFKEGTSAFLEKRKPVFPGN